MRLGVLRFGLGIEIETLLAPLGEAGIDIVTAEAPITDAATALREGERIGRADCDVVLLSVLSEAEAVLVAPAVLTIGCPLLLAGPFSTAFGTAAGALAEIGVGFDRLILTGDATDGERLLTYFRANERRERQKGIEAAQKLYGQRLALLASGALPPFDAAQWLRQFGIVTVSEGSEADFSAADGDAYGALTAQLLRLISEQEPRGLSVGSPLETGDTYAQLARRAGRFVLIAFRGNIEVERIAEIVVGGRLYGVPGDYRAALRAACETLAIADTIF
jgi:hypothetical protein